MADGKLSSRKIEAAKAPPPKPGKETATRILLGDGNGLFLQVTPTGAKSFVFRYRYGGGRRDMGLGPVHTVTLAEARDAALAARKLLRDGVDPLQAKRGAVAAAVADAALTRTFGQ